MPDRARGFVLLFSSVLAAAISGCNVSSETSDSAARGPETHGAPPSGSGSATSTSSSSGAPGGGSGKPGTGTVKLTLRAK